MHFFQQLFVLINVSQAIIWYATSEFTSTIPFSCELFHPAARFAWRTFLATIVGGGSFLWPFQRCRCWRYWSLKRCWRQSYVCSDIFWNQKLGTCFFSKILTYQYAIYFLTMVILMVLDHAGCSQVHLLGLQHIFEIYQTLPRCSGDLSPTLAASKTLR